MTALKVTDRAVSEWSKVRRQDRYYPPLGAGQLARTKTIEPERHSIKEQLPNIS